MHNDKNSILKKISKLLSEARIKKIAIDPIRVDNPDLSIDDAYKIQQLSLEDALRNGHRIVGRKIGLTSRSVQRQLGVNQPDFGFLLAEMAFVSGAEIEFEKFIQPKAEAEICIVLSDDLDKGSHTVADIIAATEFVFPAIEIVDSRIREWDISIVDTIADNASSGAFVLGSTPVYLEDFDHELCGMVLERNGEVVSTGAGLACMGNPLNAALWLANEMCKRGTPLEAGDLILTGALGPMVSIRKYDYFEAKISGVGQVKVRFS